jgi:iodotyrosine deiodinase
MNRDDEYRKLFPNLPEAVFEPLEFTRYPEKEMQSRAKQWYEECERRRTTRHFSTEAVPRNLVEYAVKTANTAPSGAHMQPWTYVVIDDPKLKEDIREAAEEEEFLTYVKRMSDEQRIDLARLGTDWLKSHITDAPWLVVLFKQRFGILSDGKRKKHYYVDHSVGISAGLFISAIHHMGLTTLTHTPSPMGYLSELLKRPANETAVLLFPVGYPAKDAKVPKLNRKSLQDVVQRNNGVK